MQLSDVNLTDPDIFQQAVPHDMFALLRREAPVYWWSDCRGRHCGNRNGFARLRILVTRGPEFVRGTCLLAIGLVDLPLASTASHSERGHPALAELRSQYGGIQFY